MQEVLAFLKDVDLGGHALRVLDLVQTADLCFVGLIVLVLVCLGYKMASCSTGFRTWGLRLAVATFLAYGIYGYVNAQPTDTHEMVVLAARSGVVAGAVLAAAWIVLPIMLFVYSNLRLALAAFLLYGGYALVVAGDQLTTEELPGIAMRAGIASGLAIIVAWIFQPVWDLASRYLSKALPAKQEEKTEPKPAEVAADDDENPKRRKKRRKLMLRRKRQREREQEEDDDLLQGDDEVHSINIEMRRRRDKARLTVELTYAMAMSDLGNSLPRDLFENWINRYLGDHLPPEDVEENSIQLQTILAQQRKLLASGSNPSASSHQLEELNHWFLDEQRRIQALRIDAEQKQQKLLDLQELYTSLVNRLLGDPHHAAVVPLPFTKPQSHSGPDMTPGIGQQ